MGQVGNLLQDIIINLILNSGRWHAGLEITQTPGRPAGGR
jgi:hypothetical protein